MYQYTAFDRQFVRARAAQFRDQLERNLAGELADDDFRPLRLQNGWYVQRHAPMLRVAVPYGELSARQLRMLARIAREHDHRDAGLATERGGFGHFTTRQNLQFNWIPLDEAADVMDLLAEVDMHGIQTSGNCIRNITTDALAGIAPDEPSTRAPTPRSCASGARCTPNSRSCRASSRSPIFGARRRPRRDALARHRPAPAP
jgi:sulfite reductase (NADPH) hemoprotein beta-component